MNVNDHSQLFDVHKIQFTGFNLKMIKHLDNYMKWVSAKQKFNIIKEVQFIIQIEICVEPDHEDYPGMTIFCHINHIRIYFYDYIMVNILQIQDYIMKTLQGQPYEGIYVDDSRTTDSRGSEELRSVVDFGSRVDLQYSEPSYRHSSISRERSLIYSDHDESQSLKRDELSKKDDFNPFTNIKQQEELKEGGSSEFDEGEESDEDESGENEIYSSEQSHPITTEDSKISSRENPSSEAVGDEASQDATGESASENIQSEDDRTNEVYKDFKKVTQLTTDREYYEEDEEDEESEEEFTEEIDEDSDISNPNYPSKLAYSSLPNKKIKNNYRKSKSQAEFGNELNYRLYKSGESIPMHDLKIIVSFDLLSITLGETAVDSNNKGKNAIKLI